MATEAWLLEGASIGEGDEIANSLADRINTIQTGITTIDSYGEKIDDAATDGLDGVYDSLAYRTAEVETHLHSWQRWMGLAGAPVGETHRADPIGTTTTAFQVDAGNNTWGTWYQFLGSEDTPATVGSVYMDMDKIMVEDCEDASTTYLIQIAWGTSGAAALAAGTYSDAVYISGAAFAPQGEIVVKMHRVAVGTKGWIRTWAIGQNTSTLDFWAGGHEYGGVTP